MTPHVDLSPLLALPAEFAHVQEFLNRHDAQLRMRRSVEVPWAYVLERRCRRRPACNSAMVERSDLHVQARDGYIHVGLVHPNFMTRPWNIVRELKEDGADTWAEGGAMRFLNELEYEERWMEESRKRRRRATLRDVAVDAFDPLSRLGNGDGTERTRFNNVGTTSLLPEQPSA